MKKILLTSLVFIISLMLFAGGYGFASSSPEQHRLQGKFKGDELIVKFKDRTSEGKKEELHKKSGAYKVKEFPALRMHVVKLKRARDLEQARRIYADSPDVAYAELNYRVTAQDVPNDPLFNNLWGLKNTGQTGGTPGADIGATAAWDITTGRDDGSVVVGVIDTGVDFDHEDLSGNLWVNPGETAANGLDDDGNAYIDDIYGINAITGSGNPRDDHGHGTHVAGTIGAAGNNSLGVSGVNWKVKIASCKFLDSSGHGWVSDAVECLEYFRAQKAGGVNIVATNNSWGGSGYSQALYDAIDAQRDILFIAAAGNSYSDNDESFTYPANYDLPNVLSVAATDHNDDKASFSNYGLTTVHVGAPGKDIVSLRAAGTDMAGDGNHFIPAGDPAAKYYRASGTSMATPHVTGLAALISSADAGRDWKAVKNLILSGGDSNSALTGKTVTGKRINVHGSLACGDSPVFSVLRSPSYFSAGVSALVSVLSINCASPQGPVTAVASGGEIFELHDDGISPDQAAGDGIFTASWTPGSADSSLLVSSPAGQLHIPQMTIMTNYLLEANVTSSYSQFIEPVGGTPPYAWSLSSGTLPPGLVLNAITGELSGRPTTIGLSNFAVQAIDAGNVTASKTFSLPVADGSLLEEWAATVNSGSNNFGTGVAVDGAGNIYTTGASLHDASGYDAMTAKYDSTGTRVWLKPFHRVMNDIAKKIAVDGSGNVYVVGDSDSDDGQGYDLLVMKYDPSGNVLWTRFVPRRIDHPDFTGIAVDREGNVLVTGRIYNSATDWYEAVTMKFDPNGNELWRRFAIDDGSSCQFTDLAADEYGNVYATGWSMDDVITTKRDPAGNLLWTKTLDKGGIESGWGIAVDAAGYVYITGGSGTGAFTVKYDADGTVLWERTYEQALFSIRGAELALDAAGNIYVGGYHVDLETYIADPILIKYDNMGNIVWSKVSSRGVSQYISDIAADPAGNVFTVGDTLGDFLTIKYRDASFRITSAPAPFVRMTDPYHQTLTAINGEMPYTWILSGGSLPPGFTLDSVTGEISGAPDTAGTYSFTVQVRDAASNTASATFSLTIYESLTITSIPPQAYLGTWYSSAMTAAGGRAPYVWSVASGSLPDGLFLDRITGTISGTPAAAGAFSLLLRVTDAFSATADRQVSLVVYSDSLPPVTSVYPPGGTYSAAHSVLLQANEQATIYCTVDGADPVVPDNVCPGAVPVNHSLTLKFFSVDLSGNREAIRTETYTITGGSVYTWGNNSNGQIGDGTSGNKRLTPYQVSGMSNSIAVAVGWYHTIALRNDGTVRTWGSNTYGQLGDGTSGSNRLTPYQVGGLTDIVAIAAGGNHSLALKSDGTVWAWGYNYLGQVGDGTSGNSRLAPVQVTGLSDIIAISAGGYGSLALRKDGTIWTWGDNGLGQLGDGTSGNFRPTPGQVTGFTGVVAAVSGYSHAMALKSDGTVWTWGNNYDGQLGDGTSFNFRSTPVQASGLRDIVALAGGWSHSLAVRNDGTAWAWGANEYGQVGDGTSGNYRLTPVQVNGLSGVVAVAGGERYSLALKDDGTVWAWGRNFNGQLGDGTQNNRTTPTLVNSIAQGEFIAGCGSHSIAIALPTLAIETSSLPYGVTGAAYSQTLSASGGLTPYAWSVSSGSLPNGLVLNSSTGKLSGTPTIAGSYVFTVRVTDANTATASKGLTIIIYNPLSIGTSSLPNGITGTAYSQTLSASGGLTPYAWYVSSGSLPNGLTLNSSTGVISGTLVSAGTSTFIAQVTDAVSSTATKTLSITVTDVQSGSIAVTTPNGGESWKKGTTQTISWSYTGNPGSTVKIELLKGGALNKTITSGTSLGSNGVGTFIWNIPSNQATGNDYKVRITSTSDSTKTDTSNGNFTISK